MGIVVQRQFSVAPDDRAEFERQSRLGVWKNMRHNGAQMIAYGTWAFGGRGDVVVTHSAYADFDHWTATRPWGRFATESARIEETRHLRAISAGRPRLVRESSARVIDYDDALSEPAPRARNMGDALAELPPTFGPRSIVALTEWALQPGSEQAFLDVLVEAVWPRLRSSGARVMVYGHDPLQGDDTAITFVAHPDITHWYAVGRASADVEPAREAMRSVVASRTSRLLMVMTDFGDPVA